MIVGLSRYLFWIVFIAGLLVGCSPEKEAAIPESGDTGGLNVIAVESFLADIAQNIAGDRVSVKTLIPSGLDPHAFEPTPQDIAAISDSQVLIVNGAGLEAWLDEFLANAGGERMVIEASAGLEPRIADVHPDEADLQEDASAHENDPHFWLDPNLAIDYAINIQNGLIQADPAGEQEYRQNTEKYIQQLKDLDAWIQGQVTQLPEEKRLLVTNHESFGYFADRYGFTVIGTILPGASTGVSPSAQQLGSLIDQIKSSGVKAIFLETGANPQLAEQIAQETGVKVIEGLFTHSLGGPKGEASTYLEMMKYNVLAILEGLQ